MLRFFISFSILCCLFSCDKKTIYSNYYLFQDNIWHEDSSIVFTFNSYNSTNLKFNLNISYNNDYPFQNFYTSYSLLDSSKNILNSKMIEFQLFEKRYGYPLGSGTFRNFIIDSLIINTNEIQKNSEYTFLIKHSMRENKLKGIDKIGLSITD